MRIAVTQRVDSVKGYNEMRDGLDHRWIELLNFLNIEAVVIPNQINNIKEYYKGLLLEGLILTGGNDLELLATGNNVSVARDRVERELFNTARELNHPILGVCRGMQYLCALLNESLVKTDGHVQNMHRIFFKRNINIFPDSLEVNSFHEWGIKTLKQNSQLNVLARSKDGVIECVGHNSENIYGIMWHPERKNPFSSYDLKFIDYVFKHH